MRHRIIIFLIILPLLLYAPTVFAQEPCDGGFCPLVRSLPGVSDITSLSDVINALFGIIIGLGALLAVIMIMIGGFEYMASDAITSKESGRKKMLDAVIGLLLILGTVLFFSTINPDILRLEIFDRPDTRLE
jgi:hypothetical protein